MLHFKCRGIWYKVRDDGMMTREGIPEFSYDWFFLGVSFHHWRKSLDVPFSSDVNAENFLRGLVWDRDHGTVRSWGGSYFGSLPRVTAAYRD